MVLHAVQKSIKCKTHTLSTSHDDPLTLYMPHITVIIYIYIIHVTKSLYMVDILLVTFHQCITSYGKGPSLLIVFSEKPKVNRLRNYFLCVNGLPFLGLLVLQKGANKKGGRSVPCRKPTRGGICRQRGHVQVSRYAQQRFLCTQQLTARGP